MTIACSFPVRRWLGLVAFVSLLTSIVIATTIDFAVLRRELGALEELRRIASKSATAKPEPSVPAWITVVQLLFMAFTVMVVHYPPLFIGGFLFFLAFSQATSHHQGRLDLKAPLLVGFFLAGLVIHGGLQAWWIEPVLKRLPELPLFIGAMGLTALNDNAAITYLATLVPGFTDALKYAVVAGAVTGGGLTVMPTHRTLPVRRSSNDSFPMAYPRSACSATR